MDMYSDEKLETVSCECITEESTLNGISKELEKLFNNVMSTVTDYFEEALTE